MKVSNQTAIQLGEALSEIIKKYPASDEKTVMTDISFQVKQDSGELTVLNDNDDEIFSTVIDEWIDNQDDDFSTLVSDALRQCILKRKNEMESLSLLKPYSFILVDKNNETVSELYLVDDETLIFESEELMQGLDKDLDTFIQNLLKE